MIMMVVLHCDLALVIVMPVIAIEVVMHLTVVFVVVVLLQCPNNQV